MSWRKKERRCNGVAGRTRPQDEGGRKDSNRGLEAALAIISAGQLMAWRRPITAACFVLRRCQARFRGRVPDQTLQQSHHRPRSTFVGEQSTHLDAASRRPGAQYRCFSLFHDLVVRDPERRPCIGVAYAARHSGQHAARGGGYSLASSRNARGGEKKETGCRGGARFIFGGIGRVWHGSSQCRRRDSLSVRLFSLEAISVSLIGRADLDVLCLEKRGESTKKLTTSTDDGTRTRNLRLRKATP